MDRHGVVAIEQQQQPVSALLVEARTLILEGGWVRGASKRKVGGVWCYCASGALSEARTAATTASRGVVRVEVWMAGETAATKLLVAAAPNSHRYQGRRSPWVQVVDINDRVIETHQQAVQWFDRAVELAATGGVRGR